MTSQLVAVWVVFTTAKEKALLTAYIARGIYANNNYALSCYSTQFTHIIPGNSGGNEYFQVYL